jgi:hypothetical protein
MERVVDSHWLWAVIIDCNCKEVPINPVESRSHCYLSRDLRIRDNTVRSFPDWQTYLANNGRALEHSDLYQWEWTQCQTNSVILVQLRCFVIFFVLSQRRSVNAKLNGIVTWRLFSQRYNKWIRNRSNNWRFNLIYFSNFRTIMHCYLSSRLPTLRDFRVLNSKSCRYFLTFSYYTPKPRLFFWLSSSGAEPDFLFMTYLISLINLLILPRYNPYRLINLSRNSTLGIEKSVWREFSKKLGLNSPPLTTTTDTSVHIANLKVFHSML